MATLERDKTTRNLAKLADDLPLFSASGEEPAKHPALAILDSVNPDTLSPKDALELLYKLKDAAKDS